MANTSENIIALNEEKQNLKNGLIALGVNMDGVPFTQYHEKFAEIKTSEDLDKELTEQEELLNKLDEEVNKLGDADISGQNITIYKYQDLTRVLTQGGEMATDEEYTRAEEYLQRKYALIMGGNNG